MRSVANNELRLEQIPTSDADWLAVASFAITFNGYEVWGSFEACAEIANDRRHSTLTELRTCLFFEQRRWRHFGEVPDGDSTIYIREIVEKIRGKVVAAALD